MGMNGWVSPQRVKGTRSSRTSPRLALATHSEEVSTTTGSAAHPTVSTSDDTPAQQLANLQIPDAPASSSRPRTLPSPKTPGKCMLWNFPANPAPTPPAAVRSRLVVSGLSPAGVPVTSGVRAPLCCSSVAFARATERFEMRADGMDRLPRRQARREGRTKQRTARGGGSCPSCRSGRPSIAASLGIGGRADTRRTCGTAAVCATTPRGRAAPRADRCIWAATRARSPLRAPTTGLPSSTGGRARRSTIRYASFLISHKNRRRR